MNDVNNIFNINSTNQSGGITAGIVNVGNSYIPLSDSEKKWLLQELSILLKDRKRIQVGVVSNAGSEAVILCNEIKCFLRNSAISIDEGETIFHPSNFVTGIKINIQHPEIIAIMVGHNSN